jgi:hypothetical protein
MQIAIHLGAHVTDEDRIIRCLMKNREALARHGIAVPGPRRYRQVIGDILAALKDKGPSEGVQEAILDSILDQDDVSRVIMSWASFLAMPRWSVWGSQLYVAADEKAAALANLFPSAEIEFYLAIRSPATFLPGLKREVQSGDLESILADQDPFALRWSDTVARIARAVPQARLFVWCDEDTPLLWPEILREIADHPDDMSLEGVFDWYQDIVTPQGLEVMTRWLRERPPMTDDQRRRVLVAFLDKFSRPEAVEIEATLPGWTEEMIDELDAIYEADVAQIAAMPGVDFLRP